MEMMKTSATAAAMKMMANRQTIKLYYGQQRQDSLVACVHTSAEDGMTQSHLCAHTAHSKCIHSIIVLSISWPLQFCGPCFVWPSFSLGIPWASTVLRVCMSSHSAVLRCLGCHRSLSHHLFAAPTPHTPHHTLNVPSQILVLVYLFYICTIHTSSIRRAYLNGHCINSP